MKQVILFLAASVCILSILLAVVADVNHGHGAHGGGHGDTHAEATHDAGGHGENAHDAGGHGEETHGEAAAGGAEHGEEPLDAEHGEVAVAEEVQH